METSSPEFVSDRTEKEINVEVQDSETAVQDTEKAANGIEVDLQEKAEGEPETVSTEVDGSTGVVKKTAALNWLLENKLDKKSIDEYLEHLREKEDLQQILKELEQENDYLAKENEIFEFILNEESVAQNALGQEKSEEVLPDRETFFSYPEKCFFAKKKLEDVEKKLKSKKDDCSLELQDLNCQLESLNLSIRNIKEAKDKFDKNVRIGGRHPVTKKIMLQKVEKYFSDSIRRKMELTNRYKIQIQNDTMERNKILSQIKAQEKRLASLTMTEFQEAQFEHKKSCRQLATYKEQLGKFRAKYSLLLHRLAEMKKSLEKEQTEMEQMKQSVSKLERLKEVAVKEKVRIDEKVLDLKASMRKIRLDPRRHNVPEVIDYAAANKENRMLMKEVKKWQKKVEASEQKKHLHLKALSKKKM